MRTCGGCRLCCNLFPVPALGKPAGQWCPQNDLGGCAIHAGRRPPVCSDYTCYWLDQELLDDRLRPDRIGVVISDDGVLSVEGDLVRVFRFNLVDSAVRANGILATMLEDFLGRGAAVMLLDGPESQWCYDRRRYPDLLPEHFEAAYCRWIKEDVGELIRLGAVPQGFPDVLDAVAAPGRRGPPNRTFSGNGLLTESTKERDP